MKICISQFYLWYSKQVPINVLHVFTDEPSQPGRPNILDWGPNHCDLNWAVPETDGGSPITHYVIDIKVGCFCFLFRIYNLQSAILVGLG